MNALRRNILKGATGASAVAVAVAAGLVTPSRVLAGAPRSAFEAKSLADAMKGMGLPAASDSKDISVKAPDIAENGAVVPVEVTSNIAGTTAIAIIAEKNNTPLVADFEFSGGAQGYISTRIKMGATSLVRAVVTAGGKTYQATKEVKVTIGGCGG